MLPRAWRDESGQALVLSTLMTGLVLVFLALGAIGVAFVISARSALSKGAAAGALAALEQTHASVQYEVSYVNYVCDTTCRGTPGQQTIDLSHVGTGDGQESGFGPLPGWAAAAGCVGTQWSGSAPAGSYQICSGKQAVGGGFTAPDPGAMQQAAEQWLEANVQTDGQLWNAHVTEVSVGSAGQVTVEAAADVRPTLLMFRSVRVSETAWPGTLG